MHSLGDVESVHGECCERSITESAEHFVPVTLPCDEASSLWLDVFPMVVLAKDGRQAFARLENVCVLGNESR